MGPRQLLAHGVDLRVTYAQDPALTFPLACADLSWSAGGTPRAAGTHVLPAGRSQPSPLWCAGSHPAGGFVSPSVSHAGDGCPERVFLSVSGSPGVLLADSPLLPGCRGVWCGRPRRCGARCRAWAPADPDGDAAPLALTRCGSPAAVRRDSALHRPALPPAHHSPVLPGVHPGEPRGARRSGRCAWPWRIWPMALGPSTGSAGCVAQAACSRLSGRCVLGPRAGRGPSLGVPPIALGHTAGCTGDRTQGASGMFPGGELPLPTASLPPHSWAQRWGELCPPQDELRALPRGLEPLFPFAVAQHPLGCHALGHVALSAMCCCSSGSWWWPCRA